jgi:hypothetical protein
LAGATATIWFVLPWRLADAERGSADLDSSEKGEQRQRCHEGANVSACALRDVVIRD